MPASAAARASLASGTTAPARKRWPGSTSVLEKPRPKRTTTPGTPPSRTSKFEPSPITTTGTSRGRRATGSCRAAGARGLGGQPLGQGVRPFGAVAGSQADDDVTGSGEALERRGDLALAADRHHGGMARLTNRLGQGHVVHAIDRHLASRVERRDDDAVGVLEAGGELAEEIAHARVAVRLEDGDDTAARAGTGSL